MLNYVLATLMIVTALFLILLVLIQRGRGGGLAGAFGGMGGQSAFGTKAGDMFTRITIGVAAFWIVLCVVSLKLMGGGNSPLATTLGGSAPVNTQQTQGPASSGEGGSKGAAPTNESPPAGQAAPSSSTPDPTGAGSPPPASGGKSESSK